jgi:hypothetical protein
MKKGPLPVPINTNEDWPNPPWVARCFQMKLATSHCEPASKLLRLPKPASNDALVTQNPCAQTFTSFPPRTAIRKTWSEKNGSTKIYTTVSAHFRFPWEACLSGERIPFYQHNPCRKVSPNTTPNLHLENVALLTKYDYPDNFRKLRNFLERANLLTDNHTHLPQYLTLINSSMSRVAGHGGVNQQLSDIISIDNIDFNAH